MIDETMLIQTDIAQEIASSVSIPWEYIVVNLEVDESFGLEVDCLSFVLHKGQRESYLMPEAIETKFVSLRDTMNDKWASTTFEINSEGKFRFYFDYNKPQRINGVFNPTSLFKNYEVQLDK